MGCCFLAHELVRVARELLQTLSITKPMRRNHGTHLVVLIVAESLNRCQWQLRVFRRSCPHLPAPVRGEPFQQSQRANRIGRRRTADFVVCVAGKAFQGLQRA